MSIYVYVCCGIVHATLCSTHADQHNTIVSSAARPCSTTAAKWPLLSLLFSLSPSLLWQTPSHLLTQSLYDMCCAASSVACSSLHESRPQHPQQRQQNPEHPPPPPPPPPRLVRDSPRYLPQSCDKITRAVLRALLDRRVHDQSLCAHCSQGHLGNEPVC